jgi:hypothetical protein
MCQLGQTSQSTERKAVTLFHCCRELEATRNRMQSVMEIGLMLHVNVTCFPKAETDLTVHLFVS